MRPLASSSKYLALMPRSTPIAADNPAIVPPLSWARPSPRPRSRGRGIFLSGVVMVAVYFFARKDHP